MLEYSGADTTNPFDVSAAGVGSGLTANSGAASTTSANELVFGAGMTFDVYSTAGSGFTNRVITNFGDIAEDATVLSMGSYSVTAPVRRSAPWVLQMATFRGQSSSMPSNPPPAITGVSPNLGATSGGTAVTISGTTFAAGAAVKFGGTAASNVVVTSTGMITATTPAHTAGTVDVVVTNTDGQSGTLTNGYAYTASTSGGGGGTGGSGTGGGGAGGSINFVQQSYKTANPSGSSLVVPYPAAQTAGELKCRGGGME